MTSAPARYACPRCHRSGLPRLNQLEQLFLEGYAAFDVCERCTAELQSSVDPMTIVQVVGVLEERCR